jgi:single stranded DNA-binding protein
MNIVIMVGNVGKDPVLQQAGETKVCRFTLAVTARANEPVLWVRCEAWDGGKFQLGSLIAQHVKKGKKITIMGELRESTWTDKQDQTRKTTFVRVGNAQWDKSASTRTESPKEEQSPGWDEDGVPF